MNTFCENYQKAVKHLYVQGINSYLEVIASMVIYNSNAHAIDQ